MNNRRQTHSAEFGAHILINGTHLSDKGYTSEKNTMVSVLKEGLGFGGEMVQQIGDSTDDPQSTKGGLHAINKFTFI